MAILCSCNYLLCLTSDREVDLPIKFVVRHLVKIAKFCNSLIADNSNNYIHPMPQPMEFGQCKIEGVSPIHVLFEKRLTRSITHLINETDQSQFDIYGTGGIFYIRRIMIDNPLHYLGYGRLRLGLYSLLQHNVNLNKYKMFVDRTHDGGFYKCPSRERADDIMMVWVGGGEGSLSMGKIDISSLQKSLTELDVLFSCSPVMLANNSASISRMWLSKFSDESSQLAAMKQISLYKPFLFPSLMCLSRAAIRQYLCRGFSLIPVILSLIREKTLPISVIYYIFLHYEVLELCPKYAKCIKKTFNGECI